MALGLRELLIILLIILILFGGKKLPELARALGKAMRIFKEESERLHRDIERDMDKEANKDGPANPRA
jgi:sec-independent protein translocase protein TatA